MKPLHGLLKQQIEGLDAEPVAMPGGWPQLMECVKAAYWQAECDPASSRTRLEQLERALQQTRPDFSAAGTILEYRIGIGFEPLDRPTQLVGRRLRDFPNNHIAVMLEAAIGQAK